MGKYDIELNEQFKKALQVMEETSKNVFITGKAGTGKSLLSVAVAMDLFLNNGYEKIYIIRPHVLEEAIGFIPGDVGDKFAPLLAAIRENFKKVYGGNESKNKKLNEY